MAVHRRTAREIENGAINELDGRGAASIALLHGRERCTDGSEVSGQRRHRPRAGNQPHGGLGHDGERALGADDEARRDSGARAPEASARAGSRS